MIEISPFTTVYSILNSHPELEGVLIEMASAFKKLKKPILRNPLMKVATLKQAAAIWEIEFTEMISILRRAAAQSELETGFKNEDYLYEEPIWI